MNTQKKVQPSMFLEYPDIEKILMEAPGLSTAIMRYINAVTELAESVDSNPKWEENEKKEVKELYEWFISILNKYYISYRDIMAREHLNECQASTVIGNSVSFITPFFKELPVEIAKKLPHITFLFAGRFKAFHSFLQKTITVLESKKKIERETFYDLHAVKFMAASYSPKHGKDYFNAEDDCYELANTVISFLKEVKKCKLMKPKDVGRTSEKIKSEYRDFVKDYIENPKPNGYKALHVSFSVIINEEEHKFEIQIMSSHMDAENNRGDCQHYIHKQNSKLPLEIDYSKIFYSDFEWASNDSTAKCQDFAGLVIPKELTKTKIFRKYA